MHAMQYEYEYEYECRSCNIVKWEREREGIQKRLCESILPFGWLDKIKVTSEIIYHLGNLSHL